MPSKQRRTAVLCLPLLWLTACSGVGPDYVQPTISLSSTFVESGTAQSGEMAQLRWWSDLNDKKLNDLVLRGLEQNLSVSAASQAVSAAQANARATLPANQITGSLSGTGYRYDESGVGNYTLGSATLSASTALAGMSRRQQEALASLDATELDVGTTRLEYLSAIVGAYIDARYYQETLELTRQSIADNRRILQIVEAKRNIGDAADIDVARAQAQLSTVVAGAPNLESAFLANVYGIATLLSEPAAPLLKTMQAGAPQPMPKTSPQVGTPANLLRNRPDVQAAERRYAAAVAAIGVAESQLYPSLTLSGTVLDTTGYNESYFGPTLTLPIFNRGVLKAKRDAARATAEQAQSAWRGAVLQAVQDVQTAQSAYRLSRRKVSKFREAVAANQRAFDLTNLAFQDGAIDLLDLLNAELTLTQTRGSLAQAVQETASNWLQLQIATGSGWAITQ